jgi:hypothetical protein
MKNIKSFDTFFCNPAFWGFNAALWDFYKYQQKFKTSEI